jgi:hypothetical protein
VKPVAASLRLALPIRLDDDQDHGLTFALFPDTQPRPLAATVQDQFGAPFADTVDWSSTDDAVLTVSAAGDVTPRAAGSCEIIAASHTDPTVSVRIRADVIAGGPHDTDVTINKRLRPVSNAFLVSRLPSGAFAISVSDGDRTMLIEATADKLREFAAGLVAFTAVPETTRGEHQRIHVKGST